MTEPRRVIVEADYYADGIWWVTTKEELETPYEQWSSLTGAQREHFDRPWQELLSQELIDDLKAWNQSWDDSDGFWESAEARRAWQEQGRELAIRVQSELGTDGWEVLYNLGARVHRVHPPGSWPADTWEEEVLGYTRRGQRYAEKGPRRSRRSSKRQQETGTDGSTPTEP